MLANYLTFMGIILAGEVLFHIVYFSMAWLFSFDAQPGRKWREVFKGFVERFVLSVGIAHGVITVVIAFAALKVATKLSISVSDSDPESVLKHNDYFLLGNFLSLLFALVYAIIANVLGLITFHLPG